MEFISYARNKGEFDLGEPETPEKFVTMDEWSVFQDQLDTALRSTKGVLHHFPIAYLLRDDTKQPPPPALVNASALTQFYWLACTANEI